MAIQKTRTYKGISITDAYNKIIHLENVKNIIDILDDNGVKTGETIEYKLAFINSVRANSTGEEIFREPYSLDYDLAGANTFVQAYNYLKTLSDFSGAIDV